MFEVNEPLQIYWDVGNPGRNVLFTPTDISGQYSAGGNIGIEYDPVRQQFVIWQGDASVWYLKPPESLSANGWIIEQAPIATSPAPTVPGLFTGVLGKWDYIDAYDVFIGVNNAFTGDVWVYKPEGWTPRGFLNALAQDSGNDILGVHDVLIATTGPDLQLTVSNVNDSVEDNSNGSANSFFAVATLTNTLLTDADTNHYVL